MKILIACEESQACLTCFLQRGHDVYSCDILPTYGSYPERHLQQDVTDLLKDNWDMIIAFPPCTDLAVSCARWFPEKRANGSQQRSIDFFMLFANHPCEKKAIENPVGIMSSLYRKPDQIIQPWQFGHAQTKATCLWLTGLPKLVPTDIVEPEYIIGKDGKRYSPIHYLTKGSAQKLYGASRSTVRSKTFSGVAKAMADQWG